MDSALNQCHVNAKPDTHIRSSVTENSTELYVCNQSGVVSKRIISSLNNTNIAYNTCDTNKPPKPFLKWAGGKGRLLDEIRKHYPIKFGEKSIKYVEPFIGGGAVLFDILGNYKVKEVYISDTNRELINAYIMLRDNVSEIIGLLAKFKEDYLTCDESGKKKLYYEKRAIFNELKKTKRSGAKMAALMIFLNRTCFNGLYRVNSKGEFNVPNGIYKNPPICDITNLLKVSAALKNVNIICADYKSSADFIDGHTFVYFDPPYRPLTISSSFTAYTKDGFDDTAQKELADFIKHMALKGAHILASNSDPKNTNPEDNFFDKLYSEFNIRRIYAPRAINSKGAARGKISELLIYND